MADLYDAGGVFMTPLTLLGVVAILLAIKKGVDVYINAELPAASHRSSVNIILQLGILSFFLGILAHALGLIDMLQAIEQMGGGVSPALIAGGLQVSMIASIYGLLILMVTFIAWALLKNRVDAMEE